MFAGSADTKERDLAWFEGASLAALSRDGKTLLMGDRGQTSGQPDPPHTYLRRTEGSPAVRLGAGIPLSLSPDTKWAIARLDVDPGRCVLLPTGPGEARPLPLGNLECNMASWLPDGRRVLVDAAEPGHVRGRVLMQDVEGEERHPLTPEGFSLGLDGPSPDGKLVLAYDTSGQLVLFPVDGGEPRKIQGVGPREASAGWGADSQSLYVYLRETDLPIKVDKLDLRTGRRKPFKAITPPDVTAFGGIDTIRVTPDGSAYAYVYVHTPCILYVIEGVR
jgi:hypothetical protein